MKIVALGEHLRADKNIQSAIGESAESFLILALGSGGIAVEARDSRFGKLLAQALFELLGAFSEEINILRIALRAFLRNGLHGTAVMTFEAVAIFVVGHGDTAIDALHGGAATAADDAPGITAAVDQNQRLGLKIETFLQRGVKLGGNWTALVRLLEFFAQINKFD